jgi:hypothetical protein
MNVSPVLEEYRHHKKLLSNSLLFDSLYKRIEVLSECQNLLLENKTNDSREPKLTTSKDSEQRNLNDE